MYLADRIVWGEPPLRNPPAIKWRGFRLEDVRRVQVARRLAALSTRPHLNGKGQRPSTRTTESRRDRDPSASLSPMDNGADTEATRGVASVERCELRRKVGAVTSLLPVLVIGL